jgi:phosphoribosyl-ATP pyrophosphohydrolase/phosphoribosyl-AMP cyclohydrolase
MERATLTALKFDDRGLVPAIVQDWRDGTVLMVAYMNREALEKTLGTGIVHFWSRSRQSLWEKGGTSGNRQRVRDIFVDCDYDTLLITVTPDGPACHTGEQSCFFHRVSDLEESCEGATKTGEARGTVMDRVYETIVSRKRAMPAGSYVASLLKAGQDTILKKITEEATELVMASKGQKREEIVHEAADLVFHLLTALGYHDIPPSDVYQELARRFGHSGLAEKASRGEDVTP